MLRYFIKRSGTQFFFILCIIFLFLYISSKSHSEENIFIVDNVEEQGPLDINYSREKYINKAFYDSFEILLSRILLYKDINKVRDIDLKKIKSLINSFQILEETYRNNKYKAKFKVFYSDIRVKKFLVEKNISFSQPKNITAVFFPALFVNDTMQDFNENYFYKEWTNIKIRDETIKFILPLEDLDDISEIKDMKDRIEDLNVDNFVNKYNVKNYVFVLMDYNNKKLGMHIKTSFEDNKMSKNVFYEIENIKDEAKLKNILLDLKMKITDLWKEENVVNLLMPLSISIKFQHKKLLDLDELKKVFNKISIIDNFSLEEFNTKNSFFKIYYFGNPKKLKTELFRFGYKLQNDQGHWELYIND